MAPFNTVYPAPVSYNPQPWAVQRENPSTMPPPVLTLGQFLQQPTTPCGCKCQKRKKLTNIGSPISSHCENGTHSSCESSSSSLSPTTMTAPGPVPGSATATAPWPPVIPEGLAGGAQEVFFNTLMQSVKEANRFNSVKSSGWKNPMLYKTTLCDHWRNQGRCRFGVHCWYAHGESELRFVPRSPQLPTPEYIHQYLSYLGLPKNLVDSMINYAYQMACASVVAAPSPTTEATLPGPGGAPSPLKPAKEFELERPASCGAIPSSVPAEVPMSSEAIHLLQSKQCESGDEWDALNSILDQAFTGNYRQQSQPPPALNSPPKPTSLFNKSFRIFGDSYPIKHLLFH